MATIRWPNGSASQPRITSNFGPRKAPTAGASTFHRGTDFTGCDPVRAVADGKVIVVGTPSGWSGGGRQVWIQHNGFISRSMHMGGYKVRVGQRVYTGDILGPQDTTGTASGSHLHLEIVVNGVQIDPVPFLRARVTASPTTSGTTSDLKQVQLDLNTLGYPLVVDGQNGPATKAAVSEFQKDNGLAVDGVAGTNTKAKLLARIKDLQTLLVKVGYAIKVDGYSGPATIGSIKDFQSKNGLTVDGMAGPKTLEKLRAKATLPVGRNAIPEKRSTVDIQRLVGANPDGIWGPETTEKVIVWQKAHPPLTADGVWGPESDAVGFPPVPSSYVPIEVDGNWGPATTKALQANLGFPTAEIDGSLGPRTIKALQLALGFTGADIDGEIGPKTIKALQSSLGVRIDGDLGELTIKALQTLLNRGGKILVVPHTPEEEVVPGRNATMRPLEQIQAFLKVPTTGVWDKATSDATYAYQTAQKITTDYIWGPTCDGLAFPPVGSIHGVDYSFARPAPLVLKERGVKLAGRYLWSPTYADGRTNKGISKDELSELRAVGISTFFIYEEDGKELLGGFEAGVRVAIAAEMFRKAIGVGTVPIYFNVDYNAPAADMPKILAALDGIASVIGLNRTGLYAGYGPMKAAFDAGKITWGFQTYAWSSGKWDPRAQLQQWSNGQWGGSVDFTRAMVPEYGQRPVIATEPEVPTLSELQKAMADVTARLGDLSAAVSRLSTEIAKRLD